MKIISTVLKTYLILCFVLGNLAQAESLHIAVADHFGLPMQELLKIFEKETGITPTTTATSSGELYNKLKAGELFDVFISADVLIPEKLEQDGQGVANTRFTYAVGKLVLWSPNPNLVDKKGEVLKKANFTHIAMSNPERAPYGNATRQALEKLGLLETLKDKLVIAESPALTYKKIVEGGAELGFLPLAYLRPSKKIEGSYWIVPPQLYGRLEHQAILLKHGENNKVAKDFIAFMKTPRIQNLIESFGYSLPH
jgi:molybdate transport system substrate-binding protein